jgi:hypothetical protein
MSICGLYKQTRNTRYLWHLEGLHLTLLRTSKRSVILNGKAMMPVLHFQEWFSECETRRQQLLTSRHLLHKYLNVAVLRNRAQVLDNIAVLEVLVQRYLLMQRLRVPIVEKTNPVSPAKSQGLWALMTPHQYPPYCLAIPSFWKISLLGSCEPT